MFLFIFKILSFAGKSHIYIILEFLRLKQQLKLAEGPWLWVFLQDKALLQGLTYQDEETGQVPQNGALSNMLRLSSTAFIRGHFVVRILQYQVFGCQPLIPLNAESE